MDGWMDGWKDGWMDGCQQFLILYNCWYFVCSLIALLMALLDFSWLSFRGLGKLSDHYFKPDHSFAFFDNSPG